MKSVLGFIFGLFFSMIIASFAGENPIHILKIIFGSAFGSAYDLGLTLFYTTSLIFTGLSVCFAFHAGLFNIGAEGQLTIGALSAAAIGILLPEINSAIAIPLGILTAMIAGATWGLIPGWLKAYRDSHEVVVTMMMNFIAAGVASYFTLNILKNLDSQNPESKLVSANYMYKDFDPVASLFNESPANFSLLIAIFFALLIYILLHQTSFGFALRMSGKNKNVAELSGISSKRNQVLAMMFAGGLAGLVALNEIYGSTGKFRIGFSADFGFVGIAVALLARNNPIGIIFTAFLFGVLQKGATDLDLETQYITRDFAKILQSVIIFSVVSFQFFKWNSISTFKLNFLRKLKWKS